MNCKDELSKKRSKERQYAFDMIFDKDSGQIEIYNNTTKPLIDGVIEGYNATVFAYGATGAGKTYTMIGTQDNPGIMFLTIKELFERVEKSRGDKAYQVKVSFLEIYNEMIRDLLIISNDVLDLREDAQHGIHVAGISIIDVDSPEEVMDLLFFGNENRTQEATNVNETSSRSHAVLEIRVAQKNKSEDVHEDINIGKLSMIDLAGSERAARTQNRGIRMVEGAMINRSLLSLGNCINALVENVEKGTTHHIPYRDSKLTRLLKDSLGGNSRTVMIANISPSHLCYEDTNNTLKYANRAKNIKTRVIKNTQHVDHHISEYAKIISQLKDEISELKFKLAYDASPMKMLTNGETFQR
jgi:kinesin family member 18/19